MKKIIFILIGFVFFLNFVVASPQMPAAYYGDIIYSENIPEGYYITVKVDDSIGRYCMIIDNTYGYDKNACIVTSNNPGALIEFYIGDVLLGNTVFEEMAIMNLNFTLDSLPPKPPKLPGEDDQNDENGEDSTTSSSGGGGGGSGTAITGSMIDLTPESDSKEVETTEQKEEEEIVEDDLIDTDSRDIGINRITGAMIGVMESPGGIASTIGILLAVVMLVILVTVLTGRNEE